MIIRLFNNRLFIVYLLFVGFSGSIAYSYPNYISFGYQSCMNCHYNPFGNGPLTDYGRALSAVEVSDRLIWLNKVSEETISDHSGFFGRTKNSNSWLRPSFNYRGLYLMSDVDGDNSDTDYIHMDTSASVVLKFMEYDRLIIVGQIAYSPVPRSMRSDPDIKKYRSREHYIGYRLTDSIGLYAGLMDKVFGLRVDNHTAFSRTQTSLTQNDQTHGLVLHYYNDNFEIGINPFIGNLVQDEDLRHKGISAMGEFSLGEYSRVGVSALGSGSDYTKIMQASAHLRYGIAKGHSILAEIGMVDTEQKLSTIKNKSTYLFSQTHWLLRRGLWAVGHFEYTKPNSQVDVTVIRLGPGLQFFPFQRLELRTDAYFTSREHPTQKLKDRWDLMSQVHLWF